VDCDTVSQCISCAVLCASCTQLGVLHNCSRNLLAYNNATVGLYTIHGDWLRVHCDDDGVVPYSMHVHC
jgi:hypothetical protein